jgi:hypothetical protein
MGSTHCQACGTSLSTRGPSALAVPPVKTVLPVGPTPIGVPIGSPLTNPSGTSVAKKTPSLYELLGWRKLEGQVIHVEPPYMAPQDFSWGRLLIKLVLLILILLLFGKIIFAFIFSLLIVLFVIWFVFHFLFPQSARGGSGCLSSLASQVVGFFLTRKMVGSPKAEVPVRDIRLRDASGQEHLVRIKGDIVSGNINVGDDVVVEGFDRQGTLKFSRGWNKRIRSEIKVKSR